MNKEEIKIKEFDKEQLELLLKDLQDIDKFTGFKDGAFKYELGKYQGSLLVNYIEELKEVINKAIEYIESNPLVFIGEYDYFVNDLLQMEELNKKMSFIRTLLKVLKGEENE